MIAFRLPLILGFAALAAAEEVPRAIQVAEPPKAPASPVADQVTSRSMQFRISGGTGRLRGTVAILAEETKTELLRLTGEKDTWSVPVSIRLHGKQGDPMPARTVRIRQLVVAGVRELQMDQHLSRGIERERFKRSLTASLLYERALKDLEANAGDPPLHVPPWLSDGLREAVMWRQNASDRRLYEALFKQGGLFKIEQLFALDDQEFEEMDGATRAAFRVSSGALVMALLEQPQGKEGFRSFLTEVAGFEGEMPLLMRRHFPELNLSETSLSKWWALQLANKGGMSLATDILDIEKTEAALGEALRLNFRTAEGIQHQKELSAWPELGALEEPERVAAVRYAQDGLVRLSYRCFPSYRALLSDYQKVLVSLVKNETLEVPERLSELDEIRVTMIARAKRARDYMDWFEITRARTTSGAFDDYQRLKERLKSNPHRRKDALSGYLDRMDKLFYRGEQENIFGFPGY